MKSNRSFGCDFGRAAAKAIVEGTSPMQTLSWTCYELDEVPNGEGTIGELSTEGQVAFIEDYDLKKPPWSFPGDQGHSSSATDLPTLDCTNGPPTGWASAQKMSRKLVSKWQCCCRNRIEMDLSDSEGWFDRCI